MKRCLYVEKLKRKLYYKHLETHGNTNSGQILTLLTGSGIQPFMKSVDEHILRATKEIIVKFIEMGRLSPSSVHESFKDIYKTVHDTVKKNLDPPQDVSSGPPKS
jgi:hypothetical protein